MLRFSGMKLEQNITNISELHPDPWWMDRRPCIASSHPGIGNFLPRKEMGMYTKEMNLKLVNKLPRDS
jgi:hypothetical protein